jgi:hypothetical protein
MQDVDLLASEEEEGGALDLQPQQQAHPQPQILSEAPTVAPAPPLPDLRPLVAANDRSLVDQINDVLMANRRAADAVPLPPLVAAVLAGRSNALETAPPVADPTVDHDPQEEQEVIALRREMAELRNKLRFYSDRRYAGRG